MKFILALLLLASCTHPVKAPSILTVHAPACLMAVEPVNADKCVSRSGEPLFTADGFVCIKCHPATGCIDSQYAVYCVSPDCADPACSVADRYKR